MPEIVCPQTECVYNDKSREWEGWKMGVCTHQGPVRFDTITISNAEDLKDEDFLDCESETNIEAAGRIGIELDERGVAIPNEQNREREG